MMMLSSSQLRLFVHTLLYVHVQYMLCMCVDDVSFPNLVFEQFPVIKCPSKDITVDLRFKIIIFFLIVIGIVGV